MAPSFEWYVNRQHPECLKISLASLAIVPVFKLGDRTAPNNYCPISLTSVIIKVLERIIRKQIVAFLISKGYLNPTQHGFRGGCSCLSALLNVFDDKQKTQHPSHPLHKHTTYFNTPRLKNTIFNNGRYTTNIPTDPPQSLQQT